MIHNFSSKIILKNKLNFQEAQLIGVYPSDFPTTCEPGSSVPTLRRKVGTSFKLPENLLNKEVSKKKIKYRCTKYFKKNY